MLAFISAKARNPRTYSARSEVDSELHSYTRQLLREKGEELGFKPIFVYISAGNEAGLDDTLAQLKKKGFADIIVVAQNGLPAFFPLLKWKWRMRMDEM